MSFFKYLKAVATGPKSNKDLNKEDMTEALKMILNKTCESEQSAAFLLCLRVKLESDEELKACFDLFNSYIKKVKIEESIELGFTYDIKNKQTYLFPLYAKILDKFFEKNKAYKKFSLVISSDDNQTFKDGISVKDIVTNCNLSSNLYYFARDEFFKELSSLSSLRKKLYMRTIFNTVEKLLNPANSKYAITSAFHKPYVKKYNMLFKDSYENLLILKGNEGNPEVFSDFKYWIEENNELIEKKIILKDFDIHYDVVHENLSLDEMLDLIKNPSDELYKLARLNAAILLFATKRFDSIEEAYTKLKDI